MDLVSSFLSKKNINNEEDIKFENYIKGEAKLNSEKQYIIESSCCFDGNKDNFKRHYDENKILEIHLNNMLFEQDLVFDNVKKLSLIINDNVKFNKLFINNCNELYLQFNGRVEVIDKISINDCKFKQISINNHIDGNIEFQKCEFNDFNLYGFSNATIKGTFTFDFCEIKEKVNFMNFEFENKVSFKMSKFKDNVYFNNSHFKDYVDFHECEFEKIACFYGVKFYKTPNFSACYFKEPKAVNLINVDIDKLDFKSVEKYIEDNYQDESYKNEHKLRYAKNLKDSFRVIKDVLITQNNTLEAQEWHKLELYAKEKELEIQLGGDNKDSIKNIQKIKKSVIKKPSNNPSNILAKIQSLSDKYIKIYDFAVCFVMVIGKSIFNFLSSIIGILYNITKAICKIIQIILSCMLHITSISRILKFEYLKFYRKISSLGKTMLDFTLWFDCVLLQVYRNTSNHHTNFLKILNFTILMISLYAFMGFVFSKTINFISSFNSVSIIIANYFILFALIMVFFNVKRQLHQQGSILFFGIFGIFIILMMLLLSPVYIPTFCFLIYFASILFFYLLFLCEIKLFVFILRLVAYGCLIVVIILKPQLINPFAGIFSSDKLYESQFEKSLNDLNTSAIINLASILQSDFNLHLKDQNISFAELNSAKALIVANKENLLKLNVANLNIAKEVLGEKYTELLKTINQDEITENTIKSTSVLYSIILLLCIFSLQKTARKNSIVPS
ncbi:pentapeptide repeat-containing protein [Campylobacter jejuni]|uniref:pentapeptide repeat-containing protein n=1 Tax=Campylobacter jejuni TaxID=197 RepID=UPI000C2942C1|nr:pentapeptide repeat-containing protein [Campylobacter jejuni]EAJ4393426.1 pentapeptide repeat-containing protein [Campylobacter jejuni]EAJ5924238.1 pentapeptide repeat-containing protein [Campylobacter jejuni]EAJ8819807.1 pentapeptide repeat-containing protein [Campylobacter jejuni]EAL5855735.1 pentapeptide repeat-containing protein [Campylobacter jejuni]ECK6691578.1 pentapeptide repeat-containing protein [Campylobacter jejuni]